MHITLPNNYPTTHVQTPTQYHGMKYAAIKLLPHLCVFAHGKQKCFACEKYKPLSFYNTNGVLMPRGLMRLSGWKTILLTLSLNKNLLVC